MNQTIDSQSGSSPRKYRIHLPKNYTNDEPVPLILSFHGRSRDMKYQEKLSQFSNASYGFNGIAVYPEGVPNNQSTNQWQGDPSSHDINDILFTLELLSTLQTLYCIDHTRIYATGKSNGGGLTNLLACDPIASSRIAAFAPVSGAFYLDSETGKLPVCKPTKDRELVPILDFHGWKDETIPYEGGINTRGNANTTEIVEFVQGWAERNGFNADLNETERLCGEGKKKVTRYSWGNGAVVHYNVSNLGHDWPSEFGNLDTAETTCRGADATRVILEWFGRWRLKG